MLGVIALEELLRAPLDPIELPVREHQMHVRLRLPVTRRRFMDGPLVHPRTSELLFRKPLDQRDLLALR